MPVRVLGGWHGEAVGEVADLCWGILGGSRSGRFRFWREIGLDRVIWERGE